MKKDLRFIQSETAIMEAAIRVLIANPSAGMSEIASAAGVGRTTLYRHYETKDVLVKGLALRCMHESEQALAPMYNLKGRAAIEAIFELLMPLADRFQFLAKLWLYIESDKELAKIDKRMKQDMHHLIEQAKKRKEISQDKPTEWVVAFFDSTFSAAWTLVNSGALSVEAASDCAKDAFFNGCS